MQERRGRHKKLVLKEHMFRHDHVAAMLCSHEGEERKTQEVRAERTCV